MTSGLFLFLNVEICVEHFQSPHGLFKGGHAVGLVVVDTPVPRLANNIYSCTRLDSHVPLQSPRAAVAWMGSRLSAGGHRLCKGEGCQGDIKRRNESPTWEGAPLSKRTEVIHPLLPVHIHLRAPHSLPSQTEMERTNPLQLNLESPR